MRLSSAIPFAILNFVCGAHQIDFYVYLSTFCAFVPNIILNLFMGASFPVLSEVWAKMFHDKVKHNYSGTTNTIVVVGFVFAVIIDQYIPRLTNKKYSEIIENEQIAKFRERYAKDDDEK